MSRNKDGLATSGGAVVGTRDRRRWLQLPVVASILAIIALLSPVNTVAAEASTGYKDVVNRRNSMCLDVAHASTWPGAQVVQAGCWGGHNQKWQIEYDNTDWFTGIHYYRLRVLHSKQCLDVDHGSVQDGARISQWNCNWNHQQQFRLVSLGYGYYRLEARHSRKCVTAEDSFRHAAPVTQRTCNNHSTQQWYFR